MWQRIIFTLTVFFLTGGVLAEDTDGTAPVPSVLAPEESVLYQPCYMRCLDDKHYAHVCEGICEVGGSGASEKLANNAYECFTSCITNPAWGALWCIDRCQKWARSMEMEDIRLPPEEGVQIEGYN